MRSQPAEIGRLRPGRSIRSSGEHAPAAPIVRRPPESGPNRRFSGRTIVRRSNGRWSGSLRSYQPPRPEHRGLLVKYLGGKPRGFRVWGRTAPATEFRVALEERTVGRIAGDTVRTGRIIQLRRRWPRFAPSPVVSQRENNRHTACHHTLRHESVRCIRQRLPPFSWLRQGE